MALGRNHKIFNIGNASGTIQGLTRVYHDLTLSGDGTLSSLLGVVGDKADEEVNQYVYDNSATIDEVNISYQSNSGTFLTAIPDYYATTGDINDLAQSVSENYQVKGDYLVRSDSANFYPANNPSGFITGVDLSNFYNKDETSGKEELSQAFADIPVGDPEVNAYVTDNSASLNGTTDLVQSNSSVWNDITVYQSNSSTYLTAHQDISNKLDTTAFSDVSGTFLTAVSIPESADWSETTDVVQTNSGKWNDITAYQNASGTYLTAINIPESATWNEVSTTVQSNSASWGQGGGTTYSAGEYIDITDNTISVTGVTDLVAGNAITITTSGTSAIISSNGEAQVQSDWDVTDSNSKAYIRNKPSIPAAQIQSDWNQTNTNAKDYIKNKPSIPSYTGASGINVSSNIVSLDNPIGLVAGDNITITVSGTSAIISANGGTMESFELSAGNNISIVNDIVNSATVISVTGLSSSEWNDTTDVVQTNSSNWDEISAYQNVSSTYLTAIPNTLSISVLSATDRVRVGNDKTYSSYAHLDRNGIFFKKGTDRPYNIGIDSTGSNFYIATAKNGYARIYASSISGWNDVLNTYQNASGTYLTAVDLSDYVPVSAYNELKTSYATLSSLFATYSGQWLLPNEGV